MRTISFIILVITISFVLIAPSSPDVKSQLSVINDDVSMSDELNQSIIDGFFDGDTIGKNISSYYFVE